MVEIKEVELESVITLRQKVMYPTQDRDYVRVIGDDKALHLGLYKDELLISVISLFKELKSLQFRKFATLDTYQNMGYGTTLLNHVIDYAKGNNVKEIWCNARFDKCEFYKKFGLKKTEETFIKGKYTYVIMRKSI